MIARSRRVIPLYQRPDGRVFHRAMVRAFGAMFGGLLALSLWVALIGAIVTLVMRAVEQAG